MRMREFSRGNTEILVLCRWERPAVVGSSPCQDLSAPLPPQKPQRDGPGPRTEPAMLASCVSGTRSDPEGWVLRTHTHGKQLVAGGEMDCLFLCTALSPDPRLPWRNPRLILTLEAPLYHQLSDPRPFSAPRRPALMLRPLHGITPSLCTPPDGPVLLCPPFPSKPSPL